MKKAFLVLLVVAVGILIVIACAWYLRASIYWDLGKANLYQPSDFTEYTIGNASAQRQLTYVSIGDSLTAGVGVDTYLQSYPYVLAQKIAGDSTQVFLKPFAIPGVRSRYVLDTFIEPVIASNPDIVTLFIGINDIHGNVSQQQFQENYTQILTRLMQETDAQIYVINLPYIGTTNLISLPYQYYFNWRTQQYNEIIEKLATQYDVIYVDLYASHKPYALQNSYYARDFFHPNALGYTLWAQFIYADFRK